MLYGRELLLHGEKRNAVLDLPEIHRYGIDSYGDADYLSIYGLQPTQWYARGIRLLVIREINQRLDDELSKAAECRRAASHQGFPDLSPH